MTEQRGSRGPYKKGIERRKAVIAHAVEIFGRHGFRGGTLQQVAERVGLTPAAITKLFGSKEGLLIAVLEHWGTLTLELIGPDTRGYELLAANKKLMVYHMEHPGLLELYITMVAEATTANHPAQEFMTVRYRETLASTRRMFVDVIEEGRFRPMDPAEVANEAQCFLATMDGLEIQYLLNPSFDLAESFAMYVDGLISRLSPDIERKP